MSAQSVSPSNLPVPSSRRLPAVRGGSLLPVLAARLLPVARGSMVIVAAGFAVEYALRALANRAVGATGSQHTTCERVVATLRCKAHPVWGEIHRGA